MIESDDEQDGSVSRILREKYGISAFCCVPTGQAKQKIIDETDLADSDEEFEMTEIKQIGDILENKTGEQEELLKHLQAVNDLLDKLRQP